MILIEFYRLTRCIFLPQYVLKTKCETKDDLRLIETCSFYIINGI